jgi:hypothetical protein
MYPQMAMIAIPELNVCVVAVVRRLNDLPLSE